MESNRKALGKVRLMSGSKKKPSTDIRHLVVGTVFDSPDSFLKLCEKQTSDYHLLSLNKVKDVASRHFPTKAIWGVVEATIPGDPHRYLFWLEQEEGSLRIAGIERLKWAGQP